MTGTLSEWRVWCALIVACLAAERIAADDGREAFFETRIRPVLVKSCSRCHGGGQSKQGLRVDSRETLLRGGQNGPALVAGDADRSLLIQAIRRTHDEIHMPPDEELPAEVVKDFVRWVNEGAAWPANADANDPAFRTARHWAFQPIQPVVPPADPSGWSSHPIDALVAARRREKNVHPVEPAAPVALLRRLFFDLTGLPPTPGEAAEFLNDTSPRAFGRWVDRLLASPRYGERWGRHWMDVVRYADTAGDNADYPIPEARLYRDYVIDSFNADKPYDRFVREQIAGDLLAADGPPEAYAEQIVATGFLSLSRRYGTAPYEFWHLTLEDTIDTVGQTFLGLTLRCARCHDHKFDPVTASDYYALYGIFNSTRYPWAGGEEFESKRFHRQAFVPLLPRPEAETRELAFRQRLDGIAAGIARLEARLAACRPDDKPVLEQELAALRAEHFQLQRPGFPEDVPGAYAVAEGAPADAHLQESGDPGRPGAVVPRSAIAFLGPLEIPPGESGRRQLAGWLTRPANPLTSRVIVNRVWQHHFGRGIVATPSNFGLRGVPPTHPKLLDLLATRFVESGWSIKSLHRMILASSTWQLSSRADARNAASDTGNEWYWRHDRRRLDAEAIRDALLSVTGRLDSTRPRAHPFPPIAHWHWTQHTPFQDTYDTSQRSVYLMTQRLQRHPFLALFDGPDTNTTTASRPTSIVPSQALYVLNSGDVTGWADSFADRLLREAASRQERIVLACQLSYARAPTPEELVRAEAYLSAAERELTGLGADRGGRVERGAWASFGRVLLSANEFMYLD